jgi:hypothetical protein
MNWHIREYPRHPRFRTSFFRAIRSQKRTQGRPESSVGFFVRVCSRFSWTSFSVYFFSVAETADENVHEKHENARKKIRNVFAAREEIGSLYYESARMTIADCANQVKHPAWRLFRPARSSRRV